MTNKYLYRAKGSQRRYPHLIDITQLPVTDFNSWIENERHVYRQLNPNTYPRKWTDFIHRLKHQRQRLHNTGETPDQDILDYCDSYLTGKSVDLLD